MGKYWPPGLHGDREILCIPFSASRWNASLQAATDEDINPVPQHSQEVWSKAHKIFHLFQCKQGYLSLWTNREEYGVLTLMPLERHNYN